MSPDVPCPRQTLLDTEVKPHHGKQPLGLDITPFSFQKRPLDARRQDAPLRMLKDTTLAPAFTKCDSQGQ